MMNQKPTRRKAIDTALKTLPFIAAFPQILSAKTVGIGGKASPSNRLNLGFIGLGRHGRSVNLRNFAGFSDCRVATLCDVDLRQIPLARETIQEVGGDEVSEANITQDWREVVSRSDIDAVCISTPDHWHVPIALAALRSGKDVICEKTSHSIAEGRVLADTVDRYGAVFQMAMEDRALPEYRRIAEAVRNGAVGRVKRIEIMLPGGPKMQMPIKEDPIPDELDWQMWLGPAPEAPFQKERIMAEYKNQLGWRHIRDYGGGIFTDWGVHLGDTALWAMEGWETLKFSVRAKNSYHEEGVFDHPRENDVLYRFENGVELSITTGRPSIKFIGTDGWVGSEGWIGPMKSDRREVLNRVYGASDVRLPVYKGEHRNFINAVKDRGETMYSAEYYHRISTWLICGNLSDQLGRELYWDPVQESFQNDVAANALRSKEMRDPWSL